LTYVIVEPCIGRKETSCTEVCPVDCIHPKPDDPAFESAEQLFINPEDCIDCEACLAACPVDAPVPDYDVPPEWQHFVGLNAAHFQP
jgi:ferredoxin